MVISRKHTKIFLSFNFMFYKVYSKFIRLFCKYQFKYYTNRAQTLIPEKFSFNISDKRLLFLRTDFLSALPKFKRNWNSTCSQSDPYVLISGIFDNFCPEIWACTWDNNKTWNNHLSRLGEIPVKRGKYHEWAIVKPTY